MVTVYVAHATGADWYLVKRPHEYAAVGLLAAAAAACTVRAHGGRSRAHLLLAFLAVAFLAREIHWEWTTKGVYVVLAALAVWAAIWRGHLTPAVRIGRFWPWLCATGFAYVLAQVIARRAFRGVLPYEQDLHALLEEVVENAAHAMLIVTAFADRFGRRDEAAGQADA
jgi:hypothetical protein